jgi:hypothetical protein
MAGARENDTPTPKFKAYQAYIKEAVPAIGTLLLLWLRRWEMSIGTKGAVLM